MNMRLTYSAILFFYAFIITDTIGQSNWKQVGNAITTEIKVFEDQVWVGTYNGLFIINKTTGHEQRLQPWNSPLKGTGVTEVEISTEGDVWLAVYNGPLTRIRNGKWDYFDSINGLALDGAQNLQIAQNGDLWFSIYNSDLKVYRLDIGGDLHEITALLPGIELYSASTGDGMYLASRDKIHLYGNDAVQNEIEIPLMPNRYISDIGTTDNGSLYCSTRFLGNSESIYRLRKRLENGDWETLLEQEEISIGTVSTSGPGTWFRTSVDEKIVYKHYLNNEFKDYNGSDLPGTKPLLYDRDYLLGHVDADGIWWMQGYIGPFEPKVFRYEEGIVSEHISLPDGPANDGFRRVANGCNGELYGMTLNFIDVLKNDEWSQIPYQAKNRHFLRSLAINPVTCDLWFTLATDARDTNLLVRYDGTEFEEMNLGEREPYIIEFDQEGTLHVGTGGYGRYDGQSWEWIEEPFERLSFPGRKSLVRDIVTTNTGEIFTATSDSGIVHFDGNEWVSYNITNSSVPNSTSFVYEDNEGNIWTNHEEGLSRYDGEIWVNFAVPITSDLPITDIHQNQNGHFWIATYDAGLYYWNGYDFNKYDVLNSDLASDFSFDIHEDSGGRLWFLTTYSSSVLTTYGLTTDRGLFGQVYFDTDKNATYDPMVDVTLPYQKVREKTSNEIAIASQNGTYAFYPDHGDEFQLCSSSQEFELTTEPILSGTYNGVSLYGLDFGMWTGDTPENVSLDIIPGPIVCGRESSVWIKYTNESFENLSGELTLKFDEDLELISTLPTNLEYTSNSITLEIDALRPRESRGLRAIFTAPLIQDVIDSFPITDTTALNIHFEFDAKLITAQAEYESYISDNFLCSYDPNDKMAQPIGPSIDSFSLLANPIDYTIRFQNMGNYQAFDVVIRDTIDEQLDLSTLEILSSSHEMLTNIKEDRSVTFSFQDINLPPESESEAGSQGYVKYRIKPIEGLADYSKIENTAHIYFDFNPAIQTNTVGNILVENLPVNDVNEIQSESEIAWIYPNPTTRNFRINAQSAALKIHTIQIHDLAGKFIKSIKNPTLDQTFTIEDSGVYLITILTPDSRYVHKIVVQPD